MERQKLIQKLWYAHKGPVGRREFVEMSTRLHIQRLKDLLPVDNVGLALNCGCGRGEQSNIFGKSIGIDISFENIRSLIKAGSQGLVADMEFLPFRDNTFDIVYGFGILHHLTNIKKGVSEATRVLKKGGYIGFGAENNGWCPLNYIMPFIYKNWKIEKGFYRIRKNIIKKIFQELCIKEIKTCTEGMTIYGMNRMVYRITQNLERFFSRFSILKRFSGYFYIAGKKVIS